MPRLHSHNMAEGSDSSLDPNLVELRRSLRSLISLEHLELPEIRPLPAFLHRIEDLVDDGGSDDGVSPDREEDNQVSSENKEGRLDNDSGSNEERRAGETTGPSTVISHGTDGLERCVQSVIVQWLGEHQHVNLDSLETIFGNFNSKDVLMNDPSFTALLTQQMNNVRSDLSRMLKTNPELRNSWDWAAGNTSTVTSMHDSRISLCCRTERRPRSAEKRDGLRSSVEGTTFSRSTLEENASTIPYSIQSVVHSRVFC
ncbi:uncharacterized protein LOC104428837 [Eucalyptus grandis]|uniref:uncharacterized protein LOC104428837 n=1 Tax=Eucalyptus grandis TaxID=71139 RepID=UPI00192E9EA9|nr:uncharacterized protein LOC104428837 [Eucalyptus grandis]